jgi:DNA invertase Pin-like site-specific DNA recombinase
MLVGYMRVSTDTDKQVLDLQRDALIAAGVDNLTGDYVGEAGNSRRIEAAARLIPEVSKKAALFVIRPETVKSRAFR